jgi:DnaJ-class molecular chaperone
MATFKNYYQVLGVETFADADTVKSAFRKLARQFHPDLNGNNKIAEERFKDINEAYEILSNPDKRAMHDATLKVVQKPSAKAKPAASPPPPKAKTPPPADSNKPEQPGGGKDKASASSATASANNTPIGEFFESFLKKGFSEPGPKSPSEEGVFRNGSAPKNTGEKFKRGEDVVVKTAITHQEASDGVVKTVNVQHNEICRRCSGTGKVNGSVCNACAGEKVSSRLKKIDVRIPAGVKNGSRVRVAKEGGRGAGGAENGDLFLQIEIAYDPSLRIEGLDVYGEVALSVTDAVLGVEIDVSTLSGNVKMTIPSATQTGTVFRLKERGVQNGMAKGDHYVTVTVVMPENLSARERELYQELARLRPERPGLKKK